MKRLVLSLLMFSTLVFGEKIANNAMGCYNKSDALNANISIALGKMDIVQQYMDSQKCILMNASKNIKIKVLKTEYQKMGTGKAIYIQYYLLRIGNGNKIPAGKVTLWLAMETENYKQFPLIK